MRKQELEWIIEKLCSFHPEISDIVFTVGRPFQVILWGELKPVYFEEILIKTLTPFHTETLALTLLENRKKLLESLISNGYCDLSYSTEKARFRVNIFSQRESYSIVMRKLPIKIPTVEELRLPEIVKEIAKERTGLIFVTGPTDSGKSTTLAAILNIINETRTCHIITLEDPVEFVHQHKKSTLNQRELGTDFSNYPEALRATLRQAPHVILVGEIRDRETLEIAMQAAETGHLVLATLHTTDAGQTIGRIIGMFPPEDENYVRLRVAETLKWVVSQRLLPKIGGGRIIATEVMRKNLRIREVIINGETPDKTFYDVIETSVAVGMHTFDQYIIELYKKRLITEETATAYSSRRSKVIMETDKLKAQRGEKTTDIEGLKLETEYRKR